MLLRSVHIGFWMWHCWDSSWERAAGHTTTGTVSRRQHGCQQARQSSAPFMYLRHRFHILHLVSSFPRGRRRKEEFCRRRRPAVIERTGTEREGRKEKMGEGNEVKTRDSTQVEVQERGDIFFFYRPKVSKDSAHSIDDVQRLYIVLRAESGEKEVEVKQSSQSGKEAEFKEAKAEETEDESTEGRSTGKGTDKIDKSTKQSGKSFTASTDSHETSHRGQRDAKPKTDSEAEENAEAGRKSMRGEHETQSANNPEEEGAYSEDRASEQEKKTKKSDAVGEKRIAGKGSETLLKVIVMGRKSLPDPSKRTRPYWGFVELVTTDIQYVKKTFAAEKYETKTRGERENPACRPVGEGIYRLVRRKDEKKVHTHLIYKLELPGPDKQHEPQEALNIEPEGSYLIQIKNPERDNPRAQGLQNKRKATYPAHLQGKLGSYRFVAADPPDFLNYEGCELILISASDDIEEELGLDLEVDDLGNQDSSDLLSLWDDSSNERTGPVKPLIEGEWA